MYYRPWIFMITDGEPTDREELVTQVAKRVKNEESNKKIAFFAVGVEGANMEKLKEISLRAPLKLKGLNFKEMFIWLSASMQKISQSKPDEQVPLSPPGWGMV